jgi:hypothetical protein
MVTVLDPGTLELEGEATINFAQELHAELAAALRELPGPFEVQTGRLEALDLVGAQILLSLRQTLGGDRVRFSGWAPRIAEFLATAGLAAHFA